MAGLFATRESVPNVSFFSLWARVGNCRLVPKAREERRTCVESAGGKGPGDGSGGAEHSERHGCYCSCTLDGTLGGAGEQFGGRGTVAAAACDRARADWSAEVNSSRILESHSARRATSVSPAPSTSPLPRESRQSLATWVMFGRGVPLPRVPDHLRAAEASPEGHADLS